MKFIMHVRDYDHCWEEAEERDSVTTQQEAEAWAEAILQRFNDTLRPGEQPRTLLRVEVDEATVSNRSDHTWAKTNLVVIDDGKSIYDTSKCTVCGVTGKRYSLSDYVSPDSKAKWARRCDTAKRHLDKRKSGE